MLNKKSKQLLVYRNANQIILFFTMDQNWLGIFFSLLPDHLQIEKRTLFFIQT